MKVVLDSSTLVSAFISPAGSPAALLVHASQGAFSLYVSEEILAETTRALLRQRITAHYGHTPKDVARFLALITQTAQVVSDLPELPAISRGGLSLWLRRRPHAVAGSRFQPRH